MNIYLAIGAVVSGYLIGAIPFGFLIVKLFKGIDVRDIQSGRTGGTNTMRAAGFWAGLATALLDIGKNVVVVLLAKWLVEDATWIHILSAIAGIVGHNYSIYVSRKEEGKWVWHGGAGGSVALGGAMGLWWPAGPIILLMGIVVFYFVGYASVTTMSVAGAAILIFAVRAAMGSQWEYIIYGVLALALLIWALRPNIKRLFEGTERLHGFRLYLQNRRENQ